MPKAEHALNIGADSTHTTNVSPVPVFEPARGEVTYAGGQIHLRLRVARALLLFCATEGGFVALTDLDRLFGENTEKAGCRRTTLTELRRALAPAGLQIERRLGFGYRLVGAIEMRAAVPNEHAAAALRALDEATGYRAPKPRQRAKPPEAPRPIVRVPTAAELEKRGPLHGLTRQQADDRYKLLRNGQHVVAEVIAAADRQANAART